MFESARRKVERGESHLETLHAIIDSFIERHPDVVDTYIDSDTGEKVLWLNGTLQDPPPELSPIIGDALHNFRSALDHLMWEVVGLGGGEPIERITQFPIFRSVEAFRASGRVKKMLKGVRPEVQTALDRLQPGGGSDMFSEMLLAYLDHLDIVDKHRHFNLITIVHGGVFPRRGQDIHIARDIQNALFSRVGRVEHGAILARIPREYVNVDFYPTFDVAFGEGQAAGESVSRVIYSIRDQVDSLLYDFENLISSLSAE